MKTTFATIVLLTITNVSYGQRGHVAPVNPHHGDAGYRGSVTLNIVNRAAHPAPVKTVKMPNVKVDKIAANFVGRSATLPVARKSIVPLFGVYSHPGILHCNYVVWDANNAWQVERMAKRLKLALTVYNEQTGQKIFEIVP